MAPSSAGRSRGYRLLARVAPVLAAALLGVTAFPSGAASAAGGAPAPASSPGGDLLPGTIPLPAITLPPPLPTIQLPPLTLPPIPGLIGGSAPGGSAPAPSGIGAYQGLAGWIDLYDYGAAGEPSPAAYVSEMAARGVKTIYVETARWNSTSDFDFATAVGLLIDAAHGQGLKVVGWYLPGFGDQATDLRRSLAVLTYTSPGGGHFDGFAADIEDHGDTASTGQFNAGIVAYAQALRAAVPAGTILGAFVPDAKNNERAPAHWAGFPWPQIAANFDVILPMAYWSVTKNPSTCLGTQLDVTAYMDQVIDTTDSLMGQSKPMAPMGGIADCDTTREVSEYVGVLQAKGAIGGGLYDFPTLQARPDASTLWSELAGV